MSEIDKLEKITIQTRRDILRMVHKVNSGHPGGSLGCSEFLVTLFNKIMKRKDNFSMDWNNISLSVFERLFLFLKWYDINYDNQIGS